MVKFGYNFGKDINNEMELVITMRKTFLLTLEASFSYFIIYITLKYFIGTETPDLKNAVLGALIFGFFIYLMHQYVIRTRLSY